MADNRMDGGEINIQAISTDCKGIDSNTNSIINDGEINVYSSEDCINGKESITINGGKIYCNSVSNDGIGTKVGDLYVNGGFIYAVAQSSDKKGFDCSKSATFRITGGTMIGVGGDADKPTQEECIQNYLICKISSAAKDSYIAINDSENNTLAAFRLPYTYGNMLLLYSSSELETGKTFSILKDATVTGGEDFNGCIIDPSSSVGSPVKQFEVTDRYTNLQ